MYRSMMQVEVKGTYRTVEFYKKEFDAEIEDSYLYESRRQT